MVSNLGRPSTLDQDTALQHTRRRISNASVVHRCVCMHPSACCGRSSFQDVRSGIGPRRYCRLARHSKCPLPTQERSSSVRSLHHDSFSTDAGSWINMRKMNNLLEHTTLKIRRIYHSIKWLIILLYSEETARRLVSVEIAEQHISLTDNFFRHYQ